MTTSCLSFAVILTSAAIMSVTAFAQDRDKTRDKLRIDQVESADRDRTADRTRTMDRIQDRDKEADKLRIKDKDCIAGTDCDPDRDRDRTSKPAN